MCVILPVISDVGIFLLPSIEIGISNPILVGLYYSLLFLSVNKLVFAHFVLT